MTDVSSDLDGYIIYFHGTDVTKSIASYYSKQMEKQPVTAE